MRALLAALLAVTPAELSERAQMAAQAGRLEEAERLWKQAIGMDPRFFPAVFNLGLLYFNQKQWTAAVATLENAAAISPDDFNTRYLLGGAFSRLDRHEEALPQWRAALKLKGDHPRLLQLMVVEYGKGRYFQEAAAAAKRVLDLSPSDANAHFLAIKAAQDAGDTEMAFEVASASVGRFPDSARAHLEFGFHLGKRGEVEKALAHLQRAVKLDASYEEPYFFYADLQVKQGNHAAAVEPLRNAIRIRPDYIPARVLLARALMQLERFDDALKELNETVTRDPEHPQPHLLLSQIYFRLGDEKRARQARDRSLKLRRENPTVLEAVQGRPYTGQ